MVFGSGRGALLRGPELNEMAIIIVAGYWTAQYEWYAHKQALQAGLDPAIVEAIQNGKRPAAMAKEKPPSTRSALSSSTRSTVSNGMSREGLGREKGVVDLMGAISWYQMVSMLLNIIAIRCRTCSRSSSRSS